MSDFSKAKIGDKVYSLRYGYGEVRDNTTGSNFPIYVEFPKLSNTYTLCGRETHSTFTPDLYWDKPTITEPESPKRMVKKTFTAYFNIYKDWASYYTSKSAAIENAENNCIATAIELTGEYEVEE